MEYLLKVNLQLAVCCLLYLFAFRRSPFFKAGRIYLLLAPALCFVFPLISFEAPVMAAGMVTLDDLSVNAVQAVQATASRGISLLDVVLAVYVTGVFIRLGLLAYGIVRVHRITKTVSVTGGVYESPSIAQPFSFFRWIFIPASLPARERELILAHEQVHGRQFHSLDTCVYSLLDAFFWFNPFVSILFRELRLVHEYLADREVARTAENASYYGEVLVSRAAGGSVLKAAHLFSHTGSLSGRLRMLAGTYSSFSPMRYSLVIPVLAGMLWFGSCSNEGEQSVPGSGHESDPGTHASVEKQGNDPLASDVKPDVMPAYEGGTEAMMRYLGQAICYPEAAKKAKAEGRILIEFVVDENGKVKDAKVKKTADVPAEARESMEAEAIRAVESMPGWIPATKDGHKVACAMMLPVSFRLS